MRPAFVAFRQCIQFLGVATAEHDSIGNERFFQLEERMLDVASPGFLTEPRQSRFCQDNLQSLVSIKDDVPVVLERLVLDRF